MVDQRTTSEVAEMLVSLASAGQPDPTSPIMSSRSKLKLAPFAINRSRGSTPTLGEGSIAHLDWQQQIRIARAAQKAGFEGLIPAARYRGWGGPSRWCNESYDTVTWAAGLGAATERIQVFSTIHVPMAHPVKVAKELTTVDHVSGGRAAINVVAGWNIDEFAMFGIVQRDHDDRYLQAAEWLSVISRLWTEDEPFDFEGRFYQLKDAYSDPKPLQRTRPVIMNAGISPVGRQFAAASADLCFVAALDLTELKSLAEDLRERAAQLGREIQVWTTTSVLCGETEADVKRRYDYFVHENGDWEAAANSIRQSMAGGTGIQDKNLSREMLEKWVAGAAGYRLTGTPEQVVEKMQQYVEAGIDGIAAVWFDYEHEIELFGDLVAPLAEREGIRDPQRRAA